MPPQGRKEAFPLFQRLACGEGWVMPLAICRIDGSGGRGGGGWFPTDTVIYRGRGGSASPLRIGPPSLCAPEGGPTAIEHVNQTMIRQWIEHAGRGLSRPSWGGGCQPSSPFLHCCDPIPVSLSMTFQVLDWGGGRVISSLVSQRSLCHQRGRVPYRPTVGLRGGGGRWVR